MVHTPPNMPHPALPAITPTRPFCNHHADPQQEPRSLMA